MFNKKNISINKEQAKDFYHKLYLFRRFEEVVAQFYRSGKIAGFCHLYIGQEAVVTGINHFMNENDSIITAYRDHVHALIYGGNVKSVLAELCGKKEGMTGGKGGSMHFFSKKHNFYGGHGIVGATIPLGAGAALAHKYKKDGGVNIAYIGDGAVLQGQVAETFNMASLWKLPLVIVIENNRYAMGTSVKRSHANEDLSLLGVPYSIKAVKVDGMNLLDVLEKSKEALKYTRDNSTPIILDVETYRYRGHSMSDPAKYRSREEVDLFKDTKDPIDHFGKFAVGNSLMKEKDIEEIKAMVEKELKEAEDYINSSTQEPEMEELYNNIYAK